MKSKIIHLCQYIIIAILFTTLFPVNELVFAAGMNFVVNSTGDEPDAVLDMYCATAAGTCTLRAAIEAANVYPGRDSITFSISPNLVIDRVITLSSALPTIDEEITIQGPNTLGGAIIINGNGIDAHGLEILDEANTVTISDIKISNFGKSGINIDGADDVTISNCVIGPYSGLVSYPGNAWRGITLITATGAQILNNVISGNGSPTSDGSGIRIDLGGSHTIKGNKIGTDSLGMSAQPNTGSGINIFGSSNNVIGGRLAADRNIISGNGGNGIAIASGYYGGGGTYYESTATLVIGNFIGTDLSGTISLANGGAGINLSLDVNTIIGGSAAGDGNLISGNLGAGIQTSGKSTTIRGNRIGTDISRTTALPNTYGIVTYGQEGILIGGILSSESNTIAYNTKDGIYISYTSYKKQIKGNAIYENGGLGINLIADAAEAALDVSKVTSNDYGDGDAGGNQLQNFPIITSADYTGITSVTVKGYLNSTPSSLFILHFYGNDICDPSGYGEGQVYLGTTDVTTNPSGSANFSKVLSTSKQYDCISVTAMDNLGNTSEFSSSGMNFTYLPLLIK